MADESQIESFESKPKRKKFGGKKRRLAGYFNARELYAWFQYKSGKRQKEIAFELGLESERHVRRLIKRIDELLESQFKVEECQRICFLMNIYQAIDNVGWLLKKRDPRMTIEFLKGTGIFKEFITDDRDKPRLSLEELKKRQDELFKDLGISSGNGTNPVNRIPPALLSPDPPSEHQGGET